VRLTAEPGEEITDPQAVRLADAPGRWCTKFPSRRSRRTRWSLPAATAPALRDLAAPDDVAECGRADAVRDEQARDLFARAVRAADARPESNELFFPVASEDPAHGPVADS